MGGTKKRVFSVFTKPWKDVTAGELGAIVKRLGYDAVEFTLREGYQVDLADCKRGLVALRDTLAAQGVAITSVASSTEEKVFEACAEAGVPLIRIMYGVLPGKGYLESEAAWKRDIEGYLPLCERYGVKVGIQQHCGAMVNNSMELRHLLEGYDARYVGGVWDAAHSGLANEEPEQALDILWDRLALVNFKAAIFRAKTGPEAREAEYERYFTTGGQGLSSWRRAVKYLCERGYDDVVCMPAEYTDAQNTEVYAPADLAFLRALFAEYDK